MVSPYLHMYMYVIVVGVYTYTQFVYINCKAKKSKDIALDVLLLYVLDNVQYMYIVMGNGQVVKFFAHWVCHALSLIETARRRSIILNDFPAP